MQIGRTFYRSNGHDELRICPRLEDAQHAALKAAGAERIFSEKQSGAKTDRAALGRVLAALESGDVLMVTRLGRLARGTRVNVLAAVGDNGAGFAVLNALLARGRSRAINAL